VAAVAAEGAAASEPAAATGSARADRLLAAPGHSLTAGGEEVLPLVGARVLAA
jgi:hypothetical protein